MRTYFIKTFGCQANKSDSERIAGDYAARGYTAAADWKTADEVVVNTCSIRQAAEDRINGLLINLEAYFKSQNRPKPKVILTGCMTHYGSQRLLQLLPQVDEILPVGEVGFNQAALRRDQVHAWVPISTGCNHFCTFCIVPHSRGREKHRPMADILQEVRLLDDQGYSEITLLAQNVNSYPNFVQLLRQVCSIDGIKKLSFMTSNPWDFSDDLIEAIAANPKIDRFIHLPVQSGSDRILKQMNRGYTAADYLYLVEKIKSRIPDVVLGTDIIVGFPSETEADFQQTVDLAQKVNWRVAFVARYSPRPGTTAWRLYPDDIPAQEKKRRWLILDTLINQSNLNDRPLIR